jgi:GTPase SAR1 family protein
VSSNYGNYTLNLWDTCGNEKALKILPSVIYKSASAYIIQCSYDNIDSLNSIPLWLKHISVYISNNTHTTDLRFIQIIINKSELKAKKFNKKDLVRILDEHAVPNVIINEVSAKDNTNVDSIFDNLIGYISGKIYMESIIEDSCIEESFLCRRSFRLSPRFEEKIVPRRRSKNCC